MCTQKLLIWLFVAVYLPALQAQENSFCDDLLPISLVKEVCGASAFDVTVKATGIVKEDNSHCNRMYGKGTPNLFKNNLILLVSPITGNRSAKEVIESYAKGSERYASFQYLEDLGDYGVRFQQPDKGSGDTCRVVVFVKNGLLIELKDTNWGALDPEPFIMSIEQLQAIAERLAIRMVN